MKNLTTAIALVALLGLTACDREGPAERAGKSIDEAVKDMGNEIEDACEDLKKETGQKDTDC